MLDGAVDADLHLLGLVQPADLPDLTGGGDHGGGLGHGFGHFVGLQLHVDDLFAVHLRCLCVQGLLLLDQALYVGHLVQAVAVADLLVVPGGGHGVGHRLTARTRHGVELLLFGQGLVGRHGGCGGHCRGRGGVAHGSHPLRFFGRAVLFLA